MTLNQNVIHCRTNQHQGVRGVLKSIKKWYIKIVKFKAIKSVKFGLKGIIFSKLGIIFLDYQVSYSDSEILSA